MRRNSVISLILTSLCGVLSFITALQDLEAQTVKAARRHYRYLPICDSYTIGEGLPEASRWPNQLIVGLKEAGIDVELLDNPARTGWTTQDAIEFELPLAKKAKPDFITLLIGVNDWVQGVDAVDFRKRIITLLEGLQAALAPQGTMIVVSIPDFSSTSLGKIFASGRDIRKGLARFNQILSDEASKRRIEVVDIFDLSRRLNAEAGMVSEDGLHPSGLQYEEWTKRILPAVKRKLIPEPA